MLREKKFANKFKNNPKGTLQKLNELVDAGYLSARQNNIYPELTIFNYTPQTTYDRKWNIYTMASRGLVIDTEALEIRALPFAKFFNKDELKDTDLENLSSVDKGVRYEVFEKIDGSLGIGFIHKNEWIWTTRGSFESEQAKFANDFIRNKFDREQLKNICFDYKNMTFLCEIVYPENKIVVNYGNTEDLILLSMIRNKDGNEIPHNDLVLEADSLGFNVVDKYKSIKDINELMTKRTFWDKDIEGVVLKFDNGKRLKIKGEEYLRAHRLMYNLSTKAKVEAWKDGKLTELIQSVDEEFRSEIESLKNVLDLTLTHIKHRIKIIGDYVYRNGVKMKDVGEVCKQEFDADKFELSCVYSYLRNKDYDDNIRTYIYRNYREFV